MLKKLSNCIQVEADIVFSFKSTSDPLLQLVSVCVFRYMSVVMVDEGTDFGLFALACSDGALRLVSIKTSETSFSGAGEKCCSIETECLPTLMALK